MKNALKLKPLLEREIFADVVVTSLYKKIGGQCLFALKSFVTLENKRKKSL